jgi:hypothetical protein
VPSVDLKPSNNSQSTAPICGGMEIRGSDSTAKTTRAHASTTADASASVRQTMCSPSECVIRIAWRRIPSGR